MKYTEEQILAKAKKVMKDVKGKFYSEDCIEGALYQKADKIISGKNKNKIMPTWSVSIKAIFNNIDILTISDETGEPLFYMNFNTLIFDIEKDEKGYFRVGLPRD